MSSKISITRRFQFCAGHRVFKHESKCAHPHGHNYVALVTVESRGGASLDSLGRVIDFSVVKEQIGEWIDEAWDHGFLYCREDAEMCAIFQAKPFKQYVMEANPTAENMAKILFYQANDLLAYANIRCTKVVLWETENCFAEYCGE